MNWPVEYVTWYLCSICVVVTVQSIGVIGEVIERDPDFMLNLLIRESCRLPSISSCVDFMFTALRFPGPHITLLSRRYVTTQVTIAFIIYPQKTDLLKTSSAVLNFETLFWEKRACFQRGVIRKNSKLTSGLPCYPKHMQIFTDLLCITADVTGSHSENKLQIIWLTDKITVFFFSVPVKIIEFIGKGNFACK